MANSFVIYYGDSVTVTFNFSFGYIDSSYMKVYFDSVLQSTSIYTVNPSDITFDSAPGDGVEILIKRETPIGPLIDFIDGAVITEYDLDTVVKQALHVSVEAGDAASDGMGKVPDGSKWDAEDKKIANLGAGTEDGDSVRYDEFSPVKTKSDSNETKVDDLQDTSTTGGALIRGAGSYDANSLQITNLVNGSSGSTAVTRAHVDAEALHKNSGSTYDAQGIQIINVGTPLADGHSATKKYVDDNILLGATFGLASPVPVTYTGDGTTKVYDVTNVTHEQEYAMLVTLDGITQQHGNNYTLAYTSPDTWSKLTFTTAPPDGVAIAITNFGVQRAFTDYAIVAHGTTRERPMGRRLSEYHWNVKDFGALGDGSQDDTTYIQEALDMARDEGGGTVFLPEGTYKVTTSLYIHTKTVMMGVGHSTIIEINHILRGIYIGTEGIETQGNRLTNLRIKGASSISGTTTSGENAIRVHDESKDCTIDNIWIEDVPTGGIKIHRINNAANLPSAETGGVLINNVHINGTGGNGITLTTFHRSVVSNCILQNIGNHPNGNAGGVGIQATNCRGVIIANCIVEVDSNGGEALAIGSRLLDPDDGDQEAYGYHISNSRFLNRSATNNCAELFNYLHDVTFQGCYFESLLRRPLVIGQTEGQVSFDVGYVTFSGQPTDGDYVTITDNLGEVEIFEFDDDDSVTEGRTLVTIGVDYQATRTNLLNKVVEGDLFLTANGQQSGTDYLAKFTEKTLGTPNSIVEGLDAGGTWSITDFTGGDDLLAVEKPKRINFSSCHFKAIATGFSGCRINIADGITITGGHFEGTAGEFGLKLNQNARNIVVNGITTYGDKGIKTVYNGNRILSWKHLGTGDALFNNNHPLYINAQDFGARGDGATSDVAAFQAALDMFKGSVGGTLHIPPGSYILDAPLTVYNGTQITGDGSKTTLVVDHTGDVFGRDVDDWWKQCRFTNFKVKGNRVDANTNFVFNMGNSPNEISFDNLWFQDLQQGLFNIDSGGDSVRISNVNAKTIANPAVMVVGGGVRCFGLNISDSSFQDIGKDASPDASVFNLSGIRNFSISDNILNTTSSQGQDGIALTDCVEGVITGNRIIADSAPQDDPSGIRVADACDNILISSNSITSNKFGILLTTDATGTPTDIYINDNSVNSTTSSFPLYLLEGNGVYVNGGLWTTPGNIVISVGANVRDVVLMGLTTDGNIGYKIQNGDETTVREPNHQPTGTDATYDDTQGVKFGTLAKGAFTPASNGTLPVAVSSAFNVASINQVNTGRYTVTFTNKLHTPNVIPSVSLTQSGTGGEHQVFVVEITTTSMNIETKNSAGTYVNTTQVYFKIDA